jgi:hypothetical protein
MWGCVLKQRGIMEHEWEENGEFSNVKIIIIAFYCNEIILKSQDTERNTMVSFCASYNAGEIKVFGSNKKLQYSTLSTLINYSVSEMVCMAHQKKNKNIC